jgi:DNA-binding MarR family transcriptional regulator
MKSQPDAPELEPEGTDHSHTLIRETLLDVARQHGTLNPDACATLFAVVEAGRAIRRHLLAAVGEHGLSEAKFCTLTLLSRVHPEPSTPADLAYHSGVTRAAMTDVLNQMVAEGWITRERSATDRRTHCIKLTETGRQIIDRAIGNLMDAAANLLDDIKEHHSPGVTDLCTALSERMSRPPSASQRALPTGDS